MRPEPRVLGFTAIGGLSLTVGLAISEPAAVAIGAAFLLPLIYGLAEPRPVLPETSVTLSRQRLLEGDDVDVQVEVAAGARVDWLELEIGVPERARILEGPARLVLNLGAREVRTVRCVIECPRWGLYPLGAVQLLGKRGLCMVGAHARREPAQMVRVYPRGSRLRRLLKPRTTRLASGNRPAAVGGEGIEFAEIRSFRPGERPRRVNWRASARRGELLVNDRLPERSSEVVLFLDSLTEAARESESTLDLAVRAVASLVDEYLHQRDRVGLLNFGGELEWVSPSSGPRQRYQIVDAVLSSETARLFRWRDPRLIPRRVLPPQSLVVGLTPLLDWRVNRALLNLRARGYDLALIEVDPRRFMEDVRATCSEEAWRIWLLDRMVIRSQFLRAGVPVSRWDMETPLAAVVEELASKR